MKGLLPLILFIALCILVVVATEIHERQKQKKSTSAKDADLQVSKGNERPEGCCGEHLVCEKETLLQTNARIEYYDDEELDALAGIDPVDFTPDQYNSLREVFDSLQESDVPGWCRSLQLRQISLPEDIREQALLIVRERRSR